MRALALFMAVLVAGLAACANIGGQEQAMAKPIAEVQQQHAGKLMAVPGVAGIATGLDRGKSCLKVYVIEKTPELMRQIPRELGGYPVIVEETGEIRAMPGKEP